jgi:hypothetical protein
MDPASGDLSQALVDALSDNTGSGASEDRLRPDALGFNREHSFAYGPKTCTLSLGGKPDAFDRALSVTVWFILVIGLVTALLLAALDPLNLESNYLDALYTYLSVAGYLEASPLEALNISYPSRDAVNRVLRFQSRRIPATI